LQFGNVGTDGGTVALQQLATLSLSADAALPQCCIAQHVPDRHPGRLQTAEKLDPGQDRCVVVPLARLVAVSIGQQPDPLIVTDRMCCQSRAFRQFTNPHEHPSRSTTQRKLRVRVRSKSRGNRSTVTQAPARCLRRGGASLRFGTGKWTNKVCSPHGEVSLPATAKLEANSFSAGGREGADYADTRNCCSSSLLGNAHRRGIIRRSA
jgi:hypothetical protein